MTKLRQWARRQVARRFRDAPRRRLSHNREDSGFTLVETVVALAIFGVTLIPTTSVFFGGLQASAVSNQQSDAVSLAASTLAQVQSLPYNLVGFYSSEANYVATCPSTVPACSGQQTVFLGATTPTGAFAPMTNPVTLGGTTYRVTTYITWATANVPTGTCSSGSAICSQAYKQVTVVISWGGVHNLARSATESTIIYPGGQGKWTAAGGSAGSGATCPQSPGKPGDPAAAANSNPSLSPDPGQSEINVSWDAVSQANEPCYFVIDSATSSGQLPTTCSSAGAVQGSPWQPGTATSYTVTGLNPGTTYYFDILAFNKDGSNCAISETVSATTVSAAVAPSCGITSFTVTAVPSQSTAKTYEDSSGKMTDNFSLVAATTGTCSSLSVQSDLVNSSTQDPGSPYALTAGSGGQYAYTVPSQGVAWTTGQHTFTLYVGSTASGQQQSIEVCAHAGQGQKTTSPTACP